MGVKEMLKTEWYTIKHLRDLRIEYDPGGCNGCWQCYEVCPTGRWTPDYESRVVLFQDPEICVACRACVLQCPKSVIMLKVYAN
jgi:NAD-dependent dihydropyrimidine dehydrogenase PreA subunit